MFKKLFQFFSFEEKSINEDSISEDVFIENLSDFTKSFVSHYLEDTTHTHELKASKISIIKEIGSTQVLKISGQGIIFHDEHDIIKTESPFIIKYVQQEFNQSV